MYKNLNPVQLNGCPLRSGLPSFPEVSPSWHPLAALLSTDAGCTPALTRVWGSRGVEWGGSIRCRMWTVSVGQGPRAQVWDTLFWLDASPSTFSIVKGLPMHLQSCVVCMFWDTRAGRLQGPCGFTCAISLLRTVRRPGALQRPLRSWSGPQGVAACIAGVAIGGDPQCSVGLPQVVPSPVFHRNPPIHMLLWGCCGVRGVRGGDWSRDVERITARWLNDGAYGEGSSSPGVAALRRSQHQMWP